MNKNPLITVIVPIYNVEAYLEQCIRSVLEQSYGEFELILVDDGSKDKSGQIVDQMAETDSHIVPLHQKNQALPQQEMPDWNAAVEYMWHFWTEMTGIIQIFSV